MPKQKILKFLKITQPGRSFFICPQGGAYHAAVKEYESADELQTDNRRSNMVSNVIYTFTAMLCVT